jgi:hypothetical protein
MRRRANLPIFVFVSLALEHREEHRRTGIARYTLRYGLNADEMARWSPRGWPGSLRTAWQDKMMFSTHLANKNC